MTPLASRADARSFLGRGWAFPVLPDPVTGRIAMVEHEEDIKQSIRIIIGTRQGERVMRPDFGCGVHERVFESMDTGTLALVQSTVWRALRRYEPRIEVLKVDVSTEAAGDGRLLVRVDYRVRETNNRDNVVYPFYLKGP